MAEKRIAIVGAGMAGLAAAYDLTKSGHSVSLYEASASVGGLAMGFKAPHWEWPLEQYYHHWFTSDHDVLDLIEEIGQKDKLFFKGTVTALWHRGRAFAMDSGLPIPGLAVLRFPYLSWLDKFRFGVVGFYLKLTRHWQPLEQYTVHEWLPRTMGQRAYEVIWKPLLIGKFGDHYKEINMAWFWARIYKRSPRLGYFVGGFQAFADALAERVRQQGGTILLETPVQAIRPSADGGITVQAAGSETHFDACIATVSPGLLSWLAPDLPESYLAQLKALDSLGAVVLILALDRQLTGGFYWINLPAGEFPFVALIEHTNYIDPGHYGGDHLVYCGDYLPPDHPYFRMTKEEILDVFLPALVRFNPDFDRSWVRDAWFFRAPYAQPVVPLNYSRMIPDVRTPIPGLYFASMSQVYPWDRGTNYAVELGRRVARMVV